MKNFYLGIDVGGEKKGFHTAILFEGETRVHALLHFYEVTDLIRFLKSFSTQKKACLKAIAIDGPARAYRSSKNIRSAEKELVSAGYRVFYTPEKGTDSNFTNWMHQSEKLHSSLHAELNVPVYETFPSAVRDQLHASQLNLPLRLLADKNRKKHTTDYIDASLCAYTAREVDLNRARVYGNNDTDGGIYLPRQQLRPHTLCFVVEGDRVLLGKKKRGFGKGFYNGFGGKVDIESNETVLQAVERELYEEAGIQCEAYRLEGKLYFIFEGIDPIEGFVYRGINRSDEPVETEEMIPEWFNIEHIPYFSMWPDDVYWLPLFFEGKKFSYYAHFDAQNRIISQYLDTE